MYYKYGNDLKFRGWLLQINNYTSQLNELINKYIEIRKRKCKFIFSDFTYFLFSFTVPKVGIKIELDSLQIRFNTYLNILVGN
jgi:hypothetical protein